MNILSTILIATVAFTACNIGEMFILISFFINRRFTTAEIVTGQYLSAAGLIALCLLIAFGVAEFSTNLLHYLGIFPILVGLKNLYEARTLIGEEIKEEHREVRRLGINLLSVTAVTFADGSDNIGVFAPLFAHSTRGEISLTVTVFFVLIGLWCWAARYLLHHKMIGTYLRRWGVWIAPLALIAIGIYIFIA